MGREPLFRKFLAGFEHGVEDLTRMVGEAGPFAEFVDLEPVVELEVDVLGGEDGFCRSRQDAIAFALFSHETKLWLIVR